MKLTRPLATILIALSFGVVAPALAQTAAPNPPAAPNPIATGQNSSPAISSQTMLVATVNIYNAAVASQNKNNLKVAFDINNRLNVQPDIHFAVALFSGALGNPFIIDEKVFPDDLTLTAGQTVHELVNYTAPGFLSGRYKVMVISQTSTGLLLGQGDAGAVTLNGSGNWAEISPDSCYLTIQNDASGKHYTTSQGVDVNPNEILKAHCDVASHFSQSVTLTPKFEIRYRDDLGRTIPVSFPSPAAFTLAPSGKQSVTYTLPKPNTPQAYDTVLTLTDSSGQTVSNPIFFHYVIHGESATIQNVRLDKSSYAPGDTAIVSFNWTPAADSFSGSRLGGTALDGASVDITITDGDSGAPCISDTSKALPDGKDMEAISIPLAIKANCADPEVMVNLKDKAGKSLDQLSFEVNATKVRTLKNTGAQTPAQKFNFKLFLLAFIGLLLLISLIIILAKRRGGRAAAIFLLFLGSGLLLLGRGAKADTFCTSSSWVGGNDYAGPACYSVSLNKAAYQPGETITASGTLTQDAICANGRNYGGSLAVNVNNQSAKLFDYYSPMGCNSQSGSFSTAAPTAPGNYAATFTGYGGGGCFPGDGCNTVNSWTGTYVILPTCSTTAQYSLYYSVVPPPTVSISASPNPTNSGQASTLTWTSTNATSCWACNGNDGTCNSTSTYTDPTFSGNKATNGTATTSALTAPQTYWLECFNAAGASVWNHATVNVISPPTYFCQSICSSSDCGVTRQKACWEDNNGTLSSVSQSNCNSGTGCPTEICNTDCSTPNNASWREVAP